MLIFMIYCILIRKLLVFWWIIPIFLGFFMISISLKGVVGVFVNRKREKN